MFCTPLTYCDNECSIIEAMYPQPKVWEGYWRKNSKTSSVIHAAKYAPALVFPPNEVAGAAKGFRLRASGMIQAISHHATCRISFPLSPPFNFDWRPRCLSQHLSSPTLSSSSLTLFFRSSFLKVNKAIYTSPLGLPSFTA